MSHAEDKDTETDLESVLVTTVLKLEEIDADLYRSTSQWKPLGRGAVFGGLVVGQALVAAGKTRTSRDVHVHSLHCYFVRPGNVDRPILYHVDRTSDGSTFSTRSVKATQSGNVILSMLVSYQRPEKSVLLYQHAFPKVPPPEELMSIDKLMQQAAKSESISEKHRTMAAMYSAMEIPVEFKPVNPFTFILLFKTPKEPKSMFWVKARGKIGTRSNNLHRCVAAYFSDWAFLRTALYPFPRYQINMMASLDHSMWFHAPFRADEWMLYECESPRAIGGRLLVLGRLWRRDGTLAVSVAQEGVARATEKPTGDASNL